MRTDRDFLYGPWAGMGKRPVPVCIRRRHRARIALVVFGLIFLVCCGLAGLGHWQPQL